MVEGTLDIPCPKCGEKATVSVGEMKANPQFQVTCKGCGAVRRFTGHAVQGSAKNMQQAIDDVTKKLKDLGSKSSS
ncbi:MAG TPA: hypothetical protein VMU16_05870 [Candidatus Binataceae bacterium]|nr:hypothetical protein [Candidatus Binataceae bacterium]